ncbi:hypothetical protein [uncultured Phenylobacterium sp.]|uniref:hypothetical protein n=1 Tax=uncultured Phenylobacterium sp. TaxID=349273 RepID=UPI0025DF510F|nr:hypothetical protein [uncultured Phenylobacterium sp.]
MTHKQTEQEAKRAFTHGASASTAGLASDPGGTVEEQRAFDAPATRRVTPTPDGEKHDHLAKREETAEDRQEALLDEALEETFPGSDPISPKHIT